LLLVGVSLSLRYLNTVVSSVAGWDWAVVVGVGSVFLEGPRGAEVLRLFLVQGIFVSWGVQVGLEFLIGFCAVLLWCWLCSFFSSKCLRLVVKFNFKSNKLNSWHQNTTGKS
jgi:hypothetical protein